MIKILHFISDTNIGGAGRLLLNQIKNMPTGEFDITVALPRGSALIDEILKTKCHIIEYKSRPDASFSLVGAFENIQIIRKVRPHIVHSHASLSSRIAAVLCGVPSRIFTRHCVFPLPKIYENPFVKFVVGRVNSALSTVIVAVAESAKENLVQMGCDEKKITVVINGVEPLLKLSDDEKASMRAQFGLRKEDFVCSIFARLEEYKGHKTLLSAAKICLEKHPNFKFFIVGDGTNKKELKALSRELKIDQSICFLGFINDVTPIYNITDVNVNCSYGTETSSLALSEGMSIGIPAVASDYGGNPHMVNDGVNGLLFPARDEKALAAALIKLYTDGELYKRCSQGAKRRYKEEFTARAMTEKMAEIYRKEYQRIKRSKKSK